MSSDRSQPETPRAGYFIAFEGPEGAGKSTQIELLSARLARHGVGAVRTREPGGTPAGDRIREVILDPALRVEPIAEFLLYSASRAQLVYEVIAPELARNRTVVTDRFAGASLAYQGYGRGLDLEFVRSLTDRVTGGITPDLTVLLDLDVETGLGRVAQRGARDRLELADPTFHERVRRGFLELARIDPTWYRIDATAPAEAVANTIWQLVTSHHPELDSEGDRVEESR